MLTTLDRSFASLPSARPGLLVEQRTGDDHAEHRVAEELQALVGGQAAVLVRVRPVGQRETEQVRSSRTPKADSSSVAGGRPIMSTTL